MEEGWGVILDRKCFSIVYFYCVSLFQMYHPPAVFLNPASLAVFLITDNPDLGVILLLSGDVETNPGPTSNGQTDQVWQIIPSNIDYVEFLVKIARSFVSSILHQDNFWHKFSCPSAHP